METVRKNDDIEPRAVAVVIHEAVRSRGDNRTAIPTLHLIEPGTGRTVTAYFRGESDRPGTVGREEPWIANVVGYVFEDPSQQGNVIVTATEVKVWRDVPGADKVSEERLNPGDWATLQANLHTWDVVQPSQLAAQSTRHIILTQRSYLM
jgi:hypothetical protein